MDRACVHPWRLVVVFVLTLRFFFGVLALPRVVPVASSPKPAL